MGPVSQKLWFTEQYMNDHFTKYYFNGVPFYAVLHEFQRADGPESLAHDHPFDFTSFILRGWYVEEIFTIYPGGTCVLKKVRREQGQAFKVRASTIHRIVEMSEGGCWTNILPEQETRHWGFYDNLKGQTPMHRFHDEPEFTPLFPDRIELI